MVGRGAIIAISLNNTAIMSCSCNESSVVTSWIDWQNQSPWNPRDIITRAKIGGAVGTYVNSTSFHTYSGTIIASPFAYNGDPVCAALGSDSRQYVAVAILLDSGHAYPLDLQMHRCIDYSCTRVIG